LIKIIRIDLHHPYFSDSFNNKFNMKLLKPFSIVGIFLLFSCGGGQSKIDQIKQQSQLKEPTSLAEAEANWKDYNGDGPIASSFSIPAEIDQELAATGKTIYDSKCTACHKAEKKFIGPAPKDILNRRTPAWVMNMILNPEEMILKDALAKQLLIAFNGAPMANQNLTEDEARAVLEYFRTL